MSGISSKQKEGSLKKRKRKKGARIEKQKRSSMFQKKKKEDEIYKLLGEILSKERKKGDHIFL
jgi:hypothetical protein